jgi:hypothetical protein
VKYDGEGEEGAEIDMSLTKEEEEESTKSRTLPRI